TSPLGGTESPLTRTAPLATVTPEGVTANRARPELTARPAVESRVATSGRKVADRLAVSVTTSPRFTRSRPAGVSGRPPLDSGPTTTSLPAQSREFPPPRKVSRP